MKDKHLLMYMAMAEVAAKASTAVRLKVGSIAVKDNRILSVGINGTVPNASNVCEHEVNGALVTKDDVIHAEQNLIYKMARDGQAALGASLFVTIAPCLKCAMAITASGFTKVYYRNQYRSTDGVDFLITNNVSVETL